MRHPAVSFALGCLLAVALTGSGLAQEATPTGALAVMPPDEPAYGASLGDWLARQFQWQISIPAPVNPVTDPTGERCGLGQSGPVFFLAPVMGEAPEASRTCVVPAGVAVLLPLFATECSTVEPPPYFGRDEAQLRACAAAEVDAFAPEDTMEVSLDGADVPNLGRFRVQTPPITVVFPPDNLYEIPPVVGTSLIDGYAVMFAPLSAGEHMLRFSFDLPDGTPAGVTYRLFVTEPMVAASIDDAPVAGTPGP